MKLQELLPEGIVTRTSQFERRIEGALDELADMLASTVDDAPASSFLNVIRDELGNPSHPQFAMKSELYDEVAERLKIPLDRQDDFKHIAHIIAQEFLKRGGYNNAAGWSWFMQSVFSPLADRIDRLRRT